jgi:hypothetical protein
VTKVAAGFELAPLAEAAPIIDFTSVVFVKLLIRLEFSPRPSSRPEKPHEKLAYTTTEGRCIHQWRRKCGFTTGETSRRFAKQTTEYPSGQLDVNGQKLPADLGEKSLFNGRPLNDNAV